MVMMNGYIDSVVIYVKVYILYVPFWQAHCINAIISHKHLLRI